ncbi:endonuclease domain-containing protein [Microbacterium fluvii]|uniref:Endonuclease domain-containing protein n=1 Tax=Microbacterium fluvii TaxID=415215 RepID=A0ABW2HHE6_9MICO|nr:hypothetical protein [Microbacterium fluvii]MCU4673985.1 hypothetical protein [Microbacterium fluvii]
MMPSDCFFSHITAAVLWGAPVPDRIFDVAALARNPPPTYPIFDPEVLHVARLWPGRAPRGRGVSGHAVRSGFAHKVTHPESGLRLASPASTWAMLGRMLPHPYDLIAVADHFVRVHRDPVTREVVRPGLATLAQLTAAVEAGRRVGGAALREALPRVRVGAVSRTETWTRLTLIDAGLPEPALDFDVYNEYGTFIACVDMAYPALKTAVEYEGAHHASAGQWESDIDRYAALEAAGWRIVRVTKRMLFVTPRQLVSRVGAVLAERSR